MTALFALVLLAVPQEPPAAPGHWPQWRGPRRDNLSTETGLLPALRKLKPGARIVSHAHLLGEAGPAPDRTVKLTSAEDQEEQVLHLWTAPLREGK